MTYATTSADAYYVAAACSGQVARLLGPYPTHGEAAQHLDCARRLVSERYPLDMRATFATYGVTHDVGGEIRKTVFGNDRCQ